MFRILQLTDLHVFKDPNALLKGIPTRLLLEDVVRHVLTYGQTFDAVIVTGDHTHDELPESYAAVRELLSPWLHQLFQVPGNHDDRVVMRSVFSDRITGYGQDLITFAFEAPNWLGLGLDTHVPGAVPGRIEADQVAWAKQKVADSNAKNVALFCHHPPVLMNSEWMDPLGLEGRELLLDWFQQEPRVRLVCCGHVHHESHSRIGHVDVLTTPSTGIQFSPEGMTPTFVAGAPAYRIVELREDGFLSRVIRLPEIRFRPG
jgi:Icc protein